MFTEFKKPIPGVILPAAAYSGRTAYVQHVVDNHVSVDVNASDENGRSALLRAAENGHLDIVKYLVGHGASLKHTDKYVNIINI